MGDAAEPARCKMGEPVPVARALEARFKMRDLDTAPAAGGEAGDQQQHPQSDEQKPEDHEADVKIFRASWICLLF